MFRVYFTQDRRAYYCDFPADKMSDALSYMETLRKDENNSFVTFCSENPQSVGKPGVAEVGSDYNWTKRRRNERIVWPSEDVE
jgi:hypothetical protein